MNSADKIKRLFEQAKLGINPDADERVFQDVFQAQQKITKTTPAPPVNIWKIIMKNNIIKFAATVIIIVVLMTGITMFKKTSNFALADVLEHIKQVNAVCYQQKMSSTTPMMGMEMNQNMNSKVWISQDYGMRMDMEMVITSNSNSFDPNGQTNLTQTYLLPSKNQIISIIPSQKKYIQTELNDKQALATRQQGNDPNLMVEQILECNYISIGRSTIDGIEVEGFQTTDPNYQGGVYSSGQVDIKLWVDVKTQLPVQMEMDVQLSGQTNMKMHSVTYGFQWNVPVDASIFEPVVPHDYTSFTSAPIQMGFNEDTAIKGLRLLGDLIRQYPEKLDLAGLISLQNKFMKTLPDTPKDIEALPPALKRFKKETEGLSKEEQKQKIMDFTMDYAMSVMGLQMFYMQLVQENKDPAYYGDIVTPENSDKVLMRWKVSDSEYRVIYGDLHAETVTPEKLEELEAALLK